MARPHLLREPWVRPTGGYLLPFLVFGGLCLLLAGAAAWIIPPLPDINKEDRTGTLQALRSRGVIIGLAVATHTGFLFTAVQATLSLHLRSLGFSTEFGGLFFLITPGFFAISTFVSAAAIKKGFTYSLYSIALIGGGLSLLLIGLSSTFAPGLQSTVILMAVGLAGQGFFEAMGDQPVLSTIIQEARDDRVFQDDRQVSATLSGLNVCAEGIGSLMGPLISGVMAQRLGFEWATTAIGAGYLMTAVVLTIVLLFHCKTKQRSISAAAVLSDQALLLLQKPEDVHS